MMIKMNSNRIFIITFSLFLFSLQLNQTKSLYYRNIFEASEVEFFSGRLQVLKENLNLKIDTNTQCRVLSEESKNPWNESQITEVETKQNDKIYYLNTTTPGCLNFDVRSERISIVLTDPKYINVPRYAISLNYPSKIGGISVNYSMIQKQIPPSSNNTQIEITPGILSDTEYRSFSLNWGNGNIEITENNKPLPFLSLSDPDIKNNSLTLVDLKSYSMNAASWKLKNLNKKCGEGAGSVTGTIQTVLVQCWTWN